MANWEKKTECAEGTTITKAEKQNEQKTSQNPKQSTGERNTRLKTCVFLLLASIVLTLFFAGGFWLIIKKDFFDLVVLNFVAWSAPLAIVAIVQVFINYEYLLGLCAGMYYGTLFLPYALKDIGIEILGNGKYVLSFVICALIAALVCKGKIKTYN